MEHGPQSFAGSGRARGRVAGRKDIPIATLRSICRQAGWGRRRQTIRAAALIHKDEGTSYGISSPDFPGCISAGGTLDEVLAFGTEALYAHIAPMLEDGDPIPALRGLDERRADPEFTDDFGGAMIATVPAFVPDRRAQRVNITIDGDLPEEIDRSAKTFPGCRSGFLAQAARAEQSLSPAHY